MRQPSDLTSAQWEAVNHRDGPLLVLAGPGSGKTRVITRRIARLVEQGVDPGAILAITFTNKSAAEMHTRVTRLLPGVRVWVSTFHKFCARILRQRAEAVGLSSNFTIFDTADQRQLIKQTLSRLNIDAVHFSPSRIAAAVSRAKNDAKSVVQVASRYDEGIGNHFQAVVARVYPAYQQALLDANAVDFDDLLMHVATLLDDNPELRAQLDERFRYILVDEYQDTNVAQYRIVSALSQDYPNLCVTGDPDQSIYGWRGARIDNILRFEADFPQAHIVRLEQNYRSSKQILRVADRLIAHNQRRKPKALVTDNPEGVPVEFQLNLTPRDEAEYITRRILELVETERRPLSDFAVCYRVNALSRELEHAFSRNRIAHQVAAGLAFYERAEVKDMLAYLRLILNPKDEAAFRRIVNTPRRDIGSKTVARITGWAAANRIDLLSAAARADECPQLSRRAVSALESFAALIDDLARTHGDCVFELIRAVIMETDYTAEWEESDSELDRQRLANVNELIAAAQEYERSAEEGPSLQGFLESTSLAGETDKLEDASGKVTLLTLHAAKGLEFPVVFIVGLEQNLIPHERSLKGDDFGGGQNEYEEERRLLFVGMTRAMHRLVLTQSLERPSNGRVLHTIPSDFLVEMKLARCDDSFTRFESVARVHSGDEDQRTSDSGDSQLLDEGIATAASIPLVTGMDLLNGTTQPAAIPQGFAVGMTVRHPRYGLGTVVNVSGLSKRRTVTVEFEEGNTQETFVIAKCPLQPVGRG